MINQYIETTITRKVLIIETIYTNPGISPRELANQLAIRDYLVQRVINELKADPTFPLVDTHGQLTIHDLTALTNYENKLYRQSSFLSYLSFVLNNQNPNISVVNLSFILNRSTSSLYETRKQVTQALASFNLTLQKNVVSGNELTKRFLIATINYKYKLTDDKVAPSLIDRDLLNQLITKHLNLSDTGACHLAFYRQLIEIGWQRQHWQSNLANLTVLANFDQTQLATQVHALVDELAQFHPLSQPLTEPGYHYFLYITLMVAPIKITPDLYQIITTIQPYQELTRLFANPSPLKERLSEKSKTQLITFLFQQTFLHRDQFIPDPQLTIRQTNATALHPQVRSWGQTILKRTFNYELNPYFITEFSLHMQNLMYTQFQFKLGIFTIDLNPSLVDGIREHVNRHYNGQFSIITGTPTTDFKQQLTQFDSIIVLASSMAYAQLGQILANLNPHLTCLSVPSRSLIDLSPIIFNVAIKLKIAKFNDWLDSYRNKKD